MGATCLSAPRTWFLNTSGVSVVSPLFRCWPRPTAASCSTCACAPPCRQWGSAATGTDWWVRRRVGCLNTGKHIYTVSKPWRSLYKLGLRLAVSDGQGAVARAAMAPATHVGRTDAKLCSTPPNVPYRCAHAVVLYGDYNAPTSLPPAPHGPPVRGPPRGPRPHALHGVAQGAAGSDVTVDALLELDCTQCCASPLGASRVAMSCRVAQGAVWAAAVAVAAPLGWDCTWSCASQGTAGCDWVALAQGRRAMYSAVRPRTPLAA